MQTQTTVRGIPKRLSLAAMALLLLGIHISTIIPALAHEPGNEHFQRTWERTDQPVADGLASRTWMWGPDAFTDLLPEPYAESPGGERTVQYYDKARMEITNPDGDPDSIWYVTNGLLVVELITGRMQLGDDAFEQHEPALVNVAGDADDPTGPTYASLQMLLDDPAGQPGALSTARIDRSGNVSNDPTLAAYEVAFSVVDEVTNHAIASPFWDFMNAAGTVYMDGQFTNSKLFESAYFATGRPITEAYWAEVKVGGNYRDVLMQCFERRCLTYTPGNPEGFIVEAGNVGQHYYAWRYADQNAPDATAPAEPSVTATAPSPTPTEPPATPTTPPATPTEPPADPTEPPVEETPLPAIPNFRLEHTWGEEYDLRDTALDDPHGMATDADGNVFVVDMRNHRVQKYTSDGIFIGQFGELGDGPGQFNEPDGIAINSLGHIYIADTDNNRIQVFDAAGNYLKTWDGSASGKKFKLPHGVAINSDDEVYVADTANNRVVQFDMNGVYIDQWAGQESDAGPFVSPFSITIDSQDRIYLLDTINARVVRFDGAGNYLGEWGSNGTEPGKFRLPQGIAYDAGRGAILVTDTVNNRVQLFSTTGSFIALWDQAGDFNLDGPKGIASDGAGRIYVANSRDDRVEKFLLNDADTTLLFGWSDGSRGRLVRLPEHVAMDPQGGIYVAESSPVFKRYPVEARIQKFGFDGQFIWELVVGNEGGIPPNENTSGEIGGIAVDPAGFIYVIIRNLDRVIKYTLDGEYVAHWGESGSGEGQIGTAQGISVDESGNVYLVDSENHRVLKYRSDGAFVRQWGSEGSDPGEFDNPRDVAVAGNSVYVVDRYAYNVQQFDLDGNFIHRWGGLGSSPGEMRDPMAVAASGDYVLVADEGNGRIQVFSSTGHYLTEFGAEGYAEGQDRTPSEIDVTPNGRVVFADRFNYSIHVYSMDIP